MSRGSPLGLLIVDDRDVGEIPVLLAEVEPIADHELVLDREADVIDLHLDLPSRRFAEQTGGAQRSRRARPQDVLQVGERQTGIDDVLDDDDVAVLDAVAEILEQLHLAR